MTLIAPINSRSPLLNAVRGKPVAYNALTRKWVHVWQATHFDDEHLACRVIEDHGLIDVSLWDDPLLESLSNPAGTQRWGYSGPYVTYPESTP